MDALYDLLYADGEITFGGEAFVRSQHSSRVVFQEHAVSVCASGVYAEHQALLVLRCVLEVQRSASRRFTSKVRCTWAYSGTAISPRRADQAAVTGLVR